MVATASTAYNAIHQVDNAVYWLEQRSSEHRRTALVRWDPQRGTQEVLPPDFKIGTRVNEYGGGAYFPTRSTLFACNSEDDRIYQVDQSAVPRPITPSFSQSIPDRYADFRPTASGQLLVGVRERHAGDSVVSELVGIPLSGSGEILTLAMGHDFFSFPRPSPDGKWLAWISSDLPNMAWDGSQLWVAELGLDGHLGPAKLVAGGDHESVLQPEWSPSGELYFVSDRAGWWNIYRYRGREVEPVLPTEAEFADAPWEFDYSSYAFLNDREMAVRYRLGINDRLAKLDLNTRELTNLDLPVRSVKPYLRGVGDRIAFIGSSPTMVPRVMAYDLRRGELNTLAEPESSIDLTGYISTPEEIDFPTTNGNRAHMLYYPPTNRDFEALVSDRPPLIIQPHPGPTTDTKPRLDLRIQYFTSRGFAVAAVNYRGSTGYGRAYRELLTTQWGVADTEDCIVAAEHLIQIKKIDSDCVAISGASAGGFTALNAAASTNIFAAAVSSFGITNLREHRTESPRFQSAKLEHLIGPYPLNQEEYDRRSPVNRANLIRCPVLLMHGLSDTVVPTSHSQRMAEALDQAGVPYSHRKFPGEGHGFGNRALKQALEAELAFYGQVLEIHMGERLEPLPIRNSHNLRETHHPSL
ncbi:MAG: S9 family peptidase [Candidatus Dormibacteraceae bacterium]